MKSRGFTLIEILIGVALLAILLALVIAAINPAKRFQDTRNTQRFSDITALMDAINFNMLDNNGVFVCGTAFPTTTTTMADSTSVPTGYDICPCLVATTPPHIVTMPVDPLNGIADTVGSCTTYETKYDIVQNATTLVITISAPDAIADGETGGVSISR